MGTRDYHNWSHVALFNFPHAGKLVDNTEMLLVQQLVVDLNAEDAVVVVEGKRDAAALRSLGFMGTLMQFHRYGGFVRFADMAASFRRVVVLFDYDREGRYMTSKLVRLLQRRTRIDLTYRHRLARITGGRVRFVEQLAEYTPLAV